MASGHHGPRALALIAVFKFFKSATLIVLVFALFRLRHPQTAAHVIAWLSALPVASGHSQLLRGLEWVLDLDGHRVALLAGLAIAYSVLYAVEGYGLWRDAHWAKYLTVIATALFIPVEIWEIAAHVTGTKILALVINVAIVVYLLRLLRVERREEDASAARR